MDINKITVSTDPYCIDEDTILVGRKGIDAGYVFAPYIPTTQKSLREVLYDQEMVIKRLDREIKLQDLLDE